MVDYACDDRDAIKSNIARIAKENTPAIYRLDEFEGADLTVIGDHHGVPRLLSERDYDYRARMRNKLGIVKNYQ